MSLAEQCRDHFGRRAIKGGERLYDEWAIDVLETSADELIMAVFEDDLANEVFLSNLDAPEEGVRVQCTCDAYENGELCEHIWASLLYVDFVGRDSLLSEPRPGAEEESPANFKPDGGGEESDKRQAKAGPSGRGLDDSGEHRPGDSEGKEPLASNREQFGPRSRLLIGHSILQQSRTWKNVLADIVADATTRFSRVSPVKEQPRIASQIWYVINVANSLRSGQVNISVYQRETRRDGQWGAFRPFPVTPGRLLSLASDQQRRLLHLFVGHQASEDSLMANFVANYGAKEFSVPATLHEVLLPELCETGQLVSRLDDSEKIDPDCTLSWDDGEPYRFRLRVVPDDERQVWRIDGVLQRGDETVLLQQPVMLLASGLVMFQDRLARLDAEVHFGWIRNLRKHGSLDVPYLDRHALQRMLWTIPSPPDMEVPDELKLEQENVPPQGVLCLRASEKVRYGANFRAYAAVSFRYGDVEFLLHSATTALVDSENSRLLRRDFAAEQRLIDQLTALGMNPTESYVQEDAQFQFNPKQIPDVVHALSQKGWKIKMEGMPFRQAGSFRLEVSSGVDWFELDGKVDFEGVQVSLPSLLMALKHNERYIQLDDGSQGLLPEEWLKRFGRLTDLARRDGDKLRFARSQALLLDALLAAQDNTKVDREFAELREKLASFSGVEPMPEPRGFRGELRPYQRTGLGWMKFLREFRLGGCLADDMGLGKTVQVLAMLQQRRLQRLPKGQSRRPSIVVVPKSLIFNWIEEAERFTPRLRVLNYTGPGREALLDELPGQDVLLTTYGTLRRDIVQLKKINFDYAILDEAQTVKNAGSQASKACRLLNAEYRLAMTGTPVENHLGELWALFEFLNPGMLGHSKAFAGWTKQARRDVQDASLETLARTLRPLLLRRTKSQVLAELPEKSEQTLYCEMPPEQRKLYDELRDYYRASLRTKVKQQGLNRSKIHVLEALLRLRQVACHPGLIDDKRRGEAAAKLDLLLDQLREVIDEDHKALVFSQFTSLLSIVRQRLDQEGICYEYLDGQTTKRDRCVKRFQEDPECPLFLISLKAGGHGLNLTAADYVYILDPWWNPAVEAQAIDRAHRLGQNRPVFAYRLICRNTVEEKIVELQKNKRELAEAIVSANDSLIRRLTGEDLELLFS